MAEGQLVLSAEEAKLFANVLDGIGDVTAGGLDELNLGRLFRLMVKLDKRGGELGGFGPLWNLPYWMRQILHRTFAPDQQPPAKKPAPKAAGSSSPKTAGPSPKPKRLLPKGAGVSPAGGEDD